MSDEELNLWIAEKLGWTNECPDGPRGCESHICRSDGLGTLRHKIAVPNFCSDPDCTVMLMERLGFRRIETRKNGTVLACFGEYGNRVKRSCATANTIGRAVCEAFALASGLPAEGLK